MDSLAKGINYILDFINAISLQQWYVVGAVLGGSALLGGIIAWVKRRHLKKTLDKLEDWMITLNLWFYSTVVTLGGFIVAVIGFGLDPSNFLPYLGNHAPQIITLATGGYTFSKAAKKWLLNRKKSKLHVTDMLIDGISDISVSIPDDLISTADGKHIADTTDASQIHPTPPRPSSDLLQ